MKSPGNYGERVFQAPSRDHALHLAPGIAGLVPQVPRPELYTLGQAFGLALKASKRGPSARTDWSIAVGQFCDWLDTHHPRVLHWQQLTREIIAEYRDSLDLAPNSIRLRLQPIIQTDNHLARRHGLLRIAEGLGLSARAKPPAQVYLADTLDLLQHLPPRLRAGAALQALAGLRVQEVFRLTWDHIDLDAQLVEISGLVKTDWSRRVIPICDEATRHLRAMPRQKVRGINDDRLYADFQTWQGYSRSLKREIRKWNPKVSWNPKDLRNCLPTWARSVGRRGEVLEEYLGHAPRSVTDRHYIPRLGAVTRGEQQALSDAMAIFRREIVSPLDHAIHEQKKNEIFPGISTASPKAT